MPVEIFEMRKQLSLSLASIERRPKQFSKP
jgi:hypothetical protein